MKKSLVAAMFAVMMISLVGCGKAPEPRTVEPTEVAEEVAEEVTETEEVTEVAEVTEVSAPVEETTEAPVAEEPSSPYSYTDLSQTLYAQSTVNVRETPEQTGAKLGSLTTNQEVTVTGQCNETGWYRISYNGGEGFVSNSYLGSEKVASQSSKSGTVSQPASQPASNSTSQPAETTDDDDNPYAGMTVEEAADSIATTPDVYLCPVCGFETPSRDEYIAHMQAEGMPYGN